MDSHVDVSTYTIRQFDVFTLKGEISTDLKMRISIRTDKYISLEMDK